MLRPRFESLVLTGAALLAGCAATVDDMPDGVGPPEPPFAVSSFFAPSGYMGDGADPSGTALISADDPAQCAPRPSGARGDCYKFTYNAGPQLWAGVYWQFPPNNWGSVEGKALGAGASKVAFYAASERGGETLKITIGGIKDVTLPYSDDLKAEGSVTLTTTMTRYTVDLAGRTYDKVIGGFSWAANHPEGTDPATAPPIVVFLDDVVWE
ncbi:MAG TPA: hypothetical protein VM734_28630 [Kofleriaceae bacterium]|nr:hypothetical protein [Kofleriaceae bacterium]